MESIDPWGQSRDDWRSALVCSVIARCHGNKTSAKDFLLDFLPPEPTGTNEAEVLAFFRALVNQGPK